MVVLVWRRVRLPRCVASGRMSADMRALNAPMRVVEPELLDVLSEHDPRARRSRSDLRRLNRIMASGRLMLRALDRTKLVDGPQEILELGAGDGTFMLRLTRALGPRWCGSHVTLLDRLDLVDAVTAAGIRNSGWQVAATHVDVSDWITQPVPHPWHLILANLFLHHFEEPQLRGLLCAIAQRTDCFVACEPRRDRGPLLASRLVGLIGCNDVTRADAVSSVRAGFRGDELSSLWPLDAGRWHLREYAAGAFSHCFVAERAR